VAVKSLHRGRTSLLTAAAIAAAVVLLAGPVGVGAQGDGGQALFEQSCAGCHTIGGGDGAGPDLEGLTDRRDQEWVEAFVKDPEAVIASGDAYAQELADRFPAAMPNLGLSDEQIAAIVAYLGFGETTPTDTTPTETTPTETTPLPSGDVDRGKSLFTGSEDIQAGGPACLSCHSIAGVGALGGGQLGPDLTSAADRLGGEAGLASWLAAIPSPTMAPIFASRELTDEERADLAAFIASASSQERDSGQALKLVALSLGVAALIAVLALAIWRKRLAGVRRPLVDRATGRTTS
jgi:mono/diheme cytochrome c family protein